jgi:double-strand break repair protein MRE11
VSYQRPENYKEWTNILVVHQNRVSYGECNYLPVEFIDPMFDIVIYGHEHESVIHEVKSKRFTVIQPGSTVRTSLREREVGDKYCYILNIRDGVQIEKIRLETVRPFIMENMRYLNENILKERIENLISGIDTIPLVRIKLEMEKNETMNKIKFGFHFKGRIANCGEILVFCKKTKKEEERVVGYIEEKKDVTDMLWETLKKMDLKAIPEVTVVDGIKKFVEKEDKSVFEKMVNDVVENALQGVMKDDLCGDDVESKIRHIKEDINRQELSKQLECNYNEGENKEKESKVEDFIFESEGEPSDGLTFTGML